jgi:hypothetical protein
MHLMKINKVTTDAIVANIPFYVNTSSVSKIVTAAATCVVTFNMDSDTAGTVTFTVDGADAAEKLLNVTKIADYFGDVMCQLHGPGNGQRGVFNLIPSIADFHTATGIVHTGGTANTALITTAIG